MGHPWTSQDFSRLVTVGGGAEHLKDTLKRPLSCSLLSLQATSRLAAVSGCQLSLPCAAPPMAHGRCLSHREAVPPAPGASLATSPAHRPAGDPLPHVSLEICGPD